MFDPTGRTTEVARVVRFWHAVEIFSPQSLPITDARQRTFDFFPGDPMPWESGSRLEQDQIKPGQVWRHEVFGGLYRLSRVRDVLVRFLGDDADGDQQAPARGESALFACTLDEHGRLVQESAVLSECAWAIGRLLADGAAGSIATSGKWLTDSGPGSFGQESSRYGRELGGLAGSGTGPAARLDLRPLAGTDLQRFTAELADHLHVTEGLQPRGVRVRSYPIPAGRTADPVQQSFLNSYIADDLDHVASALLEDRPGAGLATYLTSNQQLSYAGRVDVRADPLAAWAGCMPGRFPPGRWLSDADHALAFSQQFAVNQIMDQLARGSGLFAVNGPPGTGKTTMLRDLIAAIVVERARRLAGLVAPGDAFSGTKVHTWQTEKMRHTITTPHSRLTGFEIVVASANNGAVDNVTTAIPGPEGIGPQWRGQAQDLDYFTSTAGLTCGGGSWGLIAARLGNLANRRTFAQSFWWGASPDGGDTVVGMKDILRDVRAAPGYWAATVEQFRRTWRRVRELAAERQAVADAIDRLRANEDERERCTAAVTTAEQRCRKIIAGQRALQEHCRAAEARGQEAHDRWQAHRRSKPGLIDRLDLDLVPGQQAVAA